MKQYLLTLLLLASCSYHTSAQTERMTSIQLLDRNGFSETISLKDRLAAYEKTDFMHHQPYQRVVRVFGKASQGKTCSKITTYHPNGQLWQYLEIINGRAHGNYQEWHPNGQLKISTYVIEGTPDVSEMAQMTWLFEGLSKVYDEQGNVIAEIPYSKGMLEGESRYYFPSGKLMKVAPYLKNEIHGAVQVFNEEGQRLETTPYCHGIKDGLSISYWPYGGLKSEERYQQGLLMQARYLNLKGEIVAQIQDGFGRQANFKDTAISSFVEYREGKVEGEIQIFNENGCLASLYFLKDGMKTGEEWEYYPSSDGARHPKLYIQWDQDMIQGVVKTWYETGVLESQREMRGNKKHGFSFAWFKEGDLMLMEEYENDVLVKGSYFKKWEKTPISKVDHGKGIATLFDKEGHFIRKIIYEKGLPQNDS